MIFLSTLLRLTFGKNKPRLDGHKYIYTRVWVCVCVCAPAGRKQSALMMITITNLTDAQFDSNDWLIDWSTDRPIVAIGTSWRHEQYAQLALWLLVLSAADCRHAPLSLLSPGFDNHLVRQQQQQQQQQLHNPRPFGLEPQPTTHGKRPRDRGPRNACVMCCLPVCIAHSAGKQKRRWRRWRRLRSVQRNPEAAAEFVSNSTLYNTNKMYLNRYLSICSIKLANYIL